ncbi:MAG: hypothetical protein WKF57_06120 [Nakamurella sp.]
MNDADLLAQRLRIALTFVFGGSIFWSASQGLVLMDAGVPIPALILFACSLLALAGLVLMWSRRGRTTGRGLRSNPPPDPTDDGRNASTSSPR